MATTLNPAPADVGLGSPEVGPWFYDDDNPNVDVTLPAPDPDLGVTVGIPGSYQWLAPTQGVLSVHAATAPRPRPLAHLRRPDGTPAFNDDKLIVLFTLLPEVAARLHELSRVIPSPDGKAATAATRPRVRHFAMEMPESATAPGGFAAFFGRFTSLGGIPAADHPETMGLFLDPITNVLRNTDAPMADLIKPGAVQFVGTPMNLLMFPALTTVRLHAFDDQGWPVDPGAVAEWWRYMAVTGYTNLWAPWQGSKRTMTVASSYTALLRNVHGGLLDGPVAARLQTANATANGPVLTRNAGANGIAFTFSAAPAIDDAPLPRLAVLPHGTFDTTLTLWQGASQPLQRDCCRVTALDIEYHLLGQARTAGLLAPDSVKRRADDQNDALRRTEVQRCAGPAGVLHATTGAALDALFNAPNAPLSAAPAAGAQGRLVAPQLDSDWGPHTPIVCANPPPDSLPAPQVDALIGGDATATRGQQVLIRLSQLQGLAGAWVRAWPLGFDLDLGMHRPLDGGAGRVDGNGNVALVATLPFGQGTGQSGMVLMVTTSTGSRSYTETRFTRPAPKGGAPVSVAGAGNANVLLCEQGQNAPANQLNNLVQPGTTLVANTANGFRLVDRSTLGSGDVAAATLLGRANNRLIAELTQPAFKKQATGDTTALSGAGATVVTAQRTGFTGMLTPGQPLPGQERLEVAYSLSSAGGALAFVGATPALSRWGELLPHQAGHPGVPAGIEIHGTGVLLDALAASSVEEFTRDRTAKWCDDLVNASVAAPAQPAAVAGPSRWTAVLKTVATGIEGEFGMLIGPINYAIYPFTGTYTDVQDWYNSQAPVDPSIVMDLLPDVAAGPGDAVARRAMHRRIRAAGWGMREAATSLQAAFERAEQLVYIETPSMDLLDIGKPGIGDLSFDTLHPIQALVDRAQAAPWLHVILCLPIRPLPGYPKGYDKVRLTLLAQAVNALRDALGDARLAVFTPSAGAGQRSVRLASTSVVVDDVYALTGSTHLSRRGLSYDASLAVAVFDDVLEHGAPREVRRFRRELIAGRLGVPPGNLPDDPRSLVELVQALNQGASARVDGDGLPALQGLAPSTQDIDIWNPEGSSFADNLNVVQWLQALMVSNAEDDVG